MSNYLTFQDAIDIAYHTPPSVRPKTLSKQKGEAILSSTAAMLDFARTHSLCRGNCEHAHRKLDKNNVVEAH